MKILNIISAFTLILAFTMVVVIGFWLVYPYKTIEFKNVPFPILNEGKVVKQGDRARYLVEACKYSKDAPVVTKNFIDGVIYSTTPVPGAIPLGCNKTIMDIYVPRAIPAGTYSVQIIARFKVNPLRTITIISNTENFNIIK